MDDSGKRALSYHERTKHHPGRYARSLGYLDWDTQPDPFRRYEGARVLPLPLMDIPDTPSWDDVLDEQVEPVPMDLDSISRLLFDSLALSAWKEAGHSRWSLRVNPSSGNLHPTEATIVWHDGIFHYAPFVHGLEERAVLTPETHSRLIAPLAASTLLVGLSSIYWRESWKYGERAFRYCQHDVGHAVAALALSAAALGWKTQMCSAIPDRDIAKLLGIAQQAGPEAEHADCVLAIGPSVPDVTRFRPSLDALPSFVGSPAPLSPEHQAWPVIDDVSAATEQIEIAETVAEPRAPWEPSKEGDHADECPRSQAAARVLFHRRRSAVEMDAHSTLPKDVFFRMLSRTLASPLSALPWAPRVHLALFVHRVDDMDPGIYFFGRHPRARDAARAAMRTELLWERTPPVDLLVPADVRDAAKMICCHQDIAADGAFAVAMLAELEPAIAQYGASFYRRLHWEAGAIGQVLYLEAEAAGVRATGIGCFFDDVLHELLGLDGRTLAMLYGFTVGGPLDDPRIRTAPPYAHLDRALSPRR